MKFKIHIFMAWKVTELALGHEKSWKIMWKVVENEQLCITKLHRYQKV